MKYIELKNLARKAFPCKIFQGKNFLARSFKEKISLQDLSRKKFPCKIFQGKHFLARSFKENISLQDLARNKFPCKILQVIAFLQGSCKILARNAFFLDQGNNNIQLSLPKTTRWWKIKLIFPLFSLAIVPNAKISGVKN